MSTSRRIVIAVGAASLVACAAQAPSRQPAFGAAVSAEEIARWDISIPPSGAGLPAGSGTAKQGAAVYGAKCPACHGEKGGGQPSPLPARGSDPPAPPPPPHPPPLVPRASKT